MEQTFENHIDGNWWTTEHIIHEHKCVIKMQLSKGCKVHIWNKENTKVLKTYRFNFASEKYLLNLANNWILNNKS